MLRVVGPGRLNRRRFVQGVGVTGLGLLAGCARPPWQAAPPPPVPRIGALTGDPPGGALREAFVQGLREHGYEDGRNIVVEWRLFAGVDEVLRLAAELVRLPVDLIFAAA